MPEWFKGTNDRNYYNREEKNVEKICLTKNKRKAKQKQKY